jgi:DNA-binding MarR family transcriptional regulator
MEKNHTHGIKLSEFWPYKAVFLAHQISKLTLSVARETANLNLTQWRVLAAIAEKPAITAVHVTRVTPMDKTLVSRAVQSLITLKLIHKLPDENDKRRLCLHTTEHGYEVYLAIAAKLTQALTPAKEQDEKAEQLLELLDEFIVRLNGPPPQDAAP